MKINNAIILAAGYSSRFVPICFDLPKGLIPVFGETLIERQIRQLKEIGITNITIVTGAYADKFDFLKSRCKLIYNKDFATKNNFSSLYAARNELGNTIISSCDLYFPHNIFQKEIEHPYFASVYINGATSQRALRIDESGKILSTRYGGENCWITFGGHACFSDEISKKIINFIEPVYNNPEYANRYWVDFHDEHLEEIPMYIKKLNAGEIIEFNSLEALKNFDPDFSALQISPTVQNICRELKIDEWELSNFLPQTDANKPSGCFFKAKNENYFYNNKSGKIYAL